MFKTYLPSSSLQPYIAFYYTIKCKSSDYEHSISEFCIPSGYSHMGFHLHGSFYVLQRNKKQQLPKFYAVGQQTERYYINSNSTMVELYGVTFQPSGLWHLFKPNMPALSNHAVAISSIFEIIPQEFTNNFDAEQSLKSRIQLLEGLFMDQLSSLQPQPNVIDSAIHLIKENYGCCSIKALTEKLGISERYLEKNFKRMVGITASTYKRLVRFNFMLSEIKAETSTDYQLLSVLFNYYDFPHFSKDFKKYCGVSPSKFQVERFNFLQEVLASKALLTNHRQKTL
ncbi:helix-turn-helix transcriptional regulator [Gelidibacter salicanalis]|uniref:Helix-turn-helix transcriptional regulator n=1 Tax=Gelidibacter salicanalis TaxID=291193 RepID=A0A5C7ABS0_9FLAO|nr:AraC family transcriptional regulator [Gelidibacter salicanalis]TXE04447.1 helix-turn-helix transcriptional regulator [Gelidibacter salicanalis]